MAVQIHIGDSLRTLQNLPDESVHCVITSPPYWGLRSYNGEDGMIGMEPTFDEHLENLVAVFREVRRVLRGDGVCVVNYGDAYAAARGGSHMPAETLAGGVSGFTEDGGRSNRNRDDGYSPRRDAHRMGFKHKDLMMMPSRVAMALQADGWYLRSMIPWIKPNPMPESVTDRPTSAVEYFFLFSKSQKYFWDQVAVRTEAVSQNRKTFRGEGDSGTPYANQHGPQDNSKLSDKQRGHGRRHEGFNGRWDDMTKEDQQANGANMRNYIIATTAGFNEAHFATFPPQVIAPFIKAGTSAEGVCPECGAPWDRESHVHNTGIRVGGGCPRKGSFMADTSDTLGVIQETITTGWKPSCECDAGEPIPATVMDPFAGAGTTGLVAQDMGRDAILLEISPEYAEMAYQRIGGIFASIINDQTEKFEANG